MPASTVFHCFTGGPAEARRCLDLGARLSFSGIVTFRSASEVQDAARICPEDRLLIETDSPYLTPVPHRGRRNEPAFVAHVGSAVAALRGTTVEDLSTLSTRNAGCIRATRSLASPPATDGTTTLRGELEEPGVTLFDTSDRRRLLVAGVTSIAALPFLLGEVGRPRRVRPSPPSARSTWRERSTPVPMGRPPAGR